MKNLTATICLAVALLLGSAGVSWSQDLQKGLTAYKSGDYATALQQWTDFARQGDYVGQYNLGQMYSKGQGVPQDYEKAVKWYKRAGGNAFLVRDKLKAARAALKIANRKRYEEIQKKQDEDEQKKYEV